MKTEQTRGIGKRWAGALAVVGAMCLAPAAQAGPYSSLVIFGDSLSDTGNVLSLTSTVTPPTPFPVYPAAPGRFSNGPVWTEVLAERLGRPGDAAPSNLLFNGAGVIPIGAPGGQNYAFGGARTGLGGSAGATTGLLGQLIAWNGSVFDASGLTRAADPDALYVVVAGANDLRDFRSGAPGAISPLAVAGNIADTVGLLAQAGARNFLVSNLPDLGKAPEAVGIEAASTAATLALNAALAASIDGLDALFASAFGIDLDIRTLDFFGLTEAVYADATTNGGAVYGIANATTPCLARGAVSGQYFAPDAADINCAVSSFSDDLHPSARAHLLVSEKAFSAVPEPGALWLAAGAMGLLASSRRRRA